jgi:hypothetical protein
MRFLNSKKSKNKIENIRNFHFSVAEDGTVTNSDALNKEVIYGIFKRNQIRELENLDYAIKNKNIELLMLDKQHRDNRREFNECSICLEKPKRVVNVPCGHCFCEECSREATHCYNCRALITHKQIIYL